MKKYILIVSCFMAIFIVYETIVTKEEQASQPVLVELGQSFENDNSNVLYIAKSLDGYVAIYVPEEDIPYIITDINVVTLPPMDQDKLKVGITIDDTYTLANFLEDFDH